MAGMEWPDPLGSEAVIEAARSGDHDTAMKLINTMVAKGIFAYFMHGGTPLEWACQKGHAEVATLLLDRGASADEKDKGDRIALLLASKGASVEGDRGGDAE